MHIEIDPDEAWIACPEPVGRSLAIRRAFRALYAERLTLYEAAMRVRAISTARCWPLPASASRPRGDAQETRSSRMDASPSSTMYPASLVAGAKTAAEAERLWRALQLDHGSTLVALGGGTTTDVVGFVAATYMRGIDWIAVPSRSSGRWTLRSGKVGSIFRRGRIS